MDLLEKAEEYCSQFCAALKAFSGLDFHVICYLDATSFPINSFLLKCTFKATNLFFFSLHTWSSAYFTSLILYLFPGLVTDS